MIRKVKGQILLITLLVLTILSIATISIVLLNSRDITQVANNQKYDQLYNSIEVEVKNLIETYGKPEATLSELALSPLNCKEQIPNANYQCDLTLVSGDLDLIGEVIVSNEKNYDNFQVFKDRSLEINLDGYRDNLDLYWFKRGVTTAEQASLEFILIYRNAGGEFRSLIDVYNASNVYTSPSVVSNNPFIFSENPSYAGNIFARRLNFSSTLSLNDRPEKLVIIPRMRNPGDSVEIDVFPTVPSLYPDQVRKFQGKSYIPTDFASPVVNTISQIPLYPQTLSVLDYALLTNGELTLN